MTALDSTIAFNRHGLHIVSDSNPVTNDHANCDHFAAVTAIGGNVVIEKLVNTNATGDIENIPLSDGQTMIFNFRGITRSNTSTGWLALTKVNQAD